MQPATNDLATVAAIEIVLLAADQHAPLEEIA